MSTIQVYNPQKTTLESGIFQARDDPGFAWSRAISSRLMLPKTRGFWPFSVVNATDDLIDLTGNAQLAVNTSVVSLALYGVTSYGHFDGTSHFAITSAALNKITGGLTVICFARLDALSTEQGFISKWGAAGSRSYRLYMTSGNVITFEVSSNGTLITSVPSTIIPVVGAWYCLIGEYNPSTSLSIWVNGTKAQNVASIPAAIFDSTSNLFLGNTNGSFLTGDLSLASLHASTINSGIALLTFDYNRPLFAIRP